MNKKKKLNYNQVIDLVFFTILAGVMSVLLWRLVIAQAIYSDIGGGYHSDILAYMQKMQGIDSGYDFPYPLFFSIGSFLNRFFPINEAIAAAEVSLNVISLFAAKYYFDRLLFSDERIPDKWYIRIIVSLVVMSCFLLSMWWLPRFGKFKLPHKDQVYIGTYTGNPWHNATYIATRPFAIVAFFSFIDLLKKYEKKVELKDAIVFGISLFLTTITKPSFTIVIVSCAGLVMAFRLIRNRFKNIKNTLALACCFVPTFIALLFQFPNVFGSKGIAAQMGEHGIGFCFFAVWKYHNPHILEAIFYANVFALVCILLFYKDIKSNVMYRFTLLMFGVSILEAGLLCEKGYRFKGFNFSWGYMHGIFFFEMVTAIMLLKATFMKEKKWFLLVMAWLFFLIQLVAGVLYFKGIYCGLDYGTLLPDSWM